MELWDYERQAWNSGAETVCGVDEAGAGPLMGPGYAAAVILPRELDIPGLNDSKKLTEKKREALYEVITTQAVSWSVTRVEAWEIDEMDILNARIPKVFYGARDSTFGACGGVTNLFMEQFPHRPALVGGILAEDCQAVLAEFFEKLRQGKPSTQSFQETRRDLKLL